MAEKDLKSMSQEELEDYFGVTCEQIEEWDDMLVRGEIPGEPVGDVIVGRPLKFGEALKVVGFKDTEGKIEAMDKRADSLGMKRSDYLRWLVDRDLAAAALA